MYKYITTNEEALKLTQELLQIKDAVAVDTETWGVNPRIESPVCQGRILLVSLYTPSWAYPVVVDETCFSVLKPWFESPSPKILANAKFDMHVLKNEGIQLNGVFFDVCTADALYDENRLSHSLKAITKDYAQYKMNPILKDGENTRYLYKHELEKFVFYAAEDALCAYMDARILEEKLKSIPFNKQYTYYDYFVKQIMYFQSVLWKMERRGICLDVPLAERFVEEMQKKIEEYEAEVYRLAGKQFNIYSHQQLATLLYDDLKIEVTKRTESQVCTECGFSYSKAVQKKFPYGCPEHGLSAMEGNASTAAATLKGIKHPVAKAILDYKAVVKAQTDVKKYLKSLNPLTGRVHSTFKLMGARTGRLSCLCAGSLVNTQKGLVGIETVEIGDSIVAHTGVHTVIGKEITGEKEVYKIETNRGLFIRCSKEHRFLTIDGWKEAGELTLQDTVYYTCKESVFGNQVDFQFKSTLAPGYTKIKLPAKWDVDLATLVGYMIADGSLFYSNYKEGKVAGIQLAFSWEDEELIAYFIELIHKLFGKKVRRRDSKSCPCLKINSTQVGELFLSLGVRHLSHNLVVPPGIFVAPKEIVAAFIRGYFEGDGCASKLTVDSVSYELLYGIRALLGMFGIHTSMYTKAPWKDHRPQWVLHILDKDIFVREIGFISEQRKAKVGVLSKGAPHSCYSCITIPDQDKFTLVQEYKHAYKAQVTKIPDSVQSFCSKVIHHNTTINEYRLRDIIRMLPNSLKQYHWMRLHVEGALEESITRITIEPAEVMYEIEVDGDHTYIASGLYTHNSATPNSQNVSNKELGWNIRDLFIASPGHTLICADYDQLEYKLLAEQCKDPLLVSMINKGYDVHSGVASVLFSLDCDISEIKDKYPKERKRAKTLNFGIVYGMGPAKLAEALGVSVEEAKQFIEQYNQRFPGINVFRSKTWDFLCMNGYVKTLTNRRRRLPHIYSSDSGLREMAKRQGFNYTAQGSAADVVMGTMNRIDRDGQTRQLGLSMLLQIHDELVFEVPDDDKHEARKAFVKRHMENPFQYTWTVPLTVEPGVGRTWKQAKG